MANKKTKYQIIVDDIRLKITQGIYAENYKLPGQLELAENYSVSAITANRALNELRKQGFIERRERSGSYVLAKTRILNKIYIVFSGKYENETINLMPYWQTITNLSLEKGITTQLISMKDLELSNKITNNSDGDFGVICLRFYQKEFIQELEKKSIPHVILGLKVEDSKCNVTENRFDAAQKLVEEIIKLNCRNIAFFGTLSFPNHHEAELGVKKAINARKLPITVNNYDINEKNIIQKAIEVINNTPDLDAIIIMGGMLPFIALPAILNIEKKTIIKGFFTENQSILQLKRYALIASYNEQNSAKLAVKMLINSSQGVSKKNKMFPSFKILNEIKE